MIRAIFAMDEEGGIGKGGSLPWPHLIEDMRWFRDHTRGHVVVMGRRTWDDPKMPKPLTQRTNVVVTNHPIPNVYTICGDITRSTLLAHAQPRQDVFVIGGADLLRNCLPLYDELIVTHIRGMYGADVRVNPGTFFTGWRAESAQVGRENVCTFIKYRRIGAQVAHASVPRNIEEAA
jgi:dihydrofolate reductase